MAIPKRLLIHNCDLLRIEGVDRFGNTNTTKYTLERVRIDTIQGQTITSVGETKSDKLVLFYDPKNSIPANFTLMVKDKIIWQGNSFEIRSISAKYTTATQPHHYEAELV